MNDMEAKFQVFFTSAHGSVRRLRTACFVVYAPEYPLLEAGWFLL
jgi:hypothetical protein